MSAKLTLAVARPRHQDQRQCRDKCNQHMLLEALRSHSKGMEGHPITGGSEVLTTVDWTSHVTALRFHRLDPSTGASVIIIVPLSSGF